MKKKLIIIFFIAASCFVANKVYAYLTSNKLEVTVSSDLDTEKVKITFGSFTINRKSDRELFNTKNTIIYNGGQTNDLSNHYGENDFLITYADSCYYQFRHFKFSDKPGDSYYFKIIKKNDTLFLSTKITGSDPITFIRPFNMVNNADSLRCNTPISKASFIYNMKELE